MPRRALPLQTIDYAVLGLLCLAPRHGYELATQFGPSGELGAALSVRLGDLYPALKRLEARGLVEGEVELQADRPPRRVFQPTAAGRDELARWLGRPVRRNRDVRLDFVVRLYFARRIPGHDPVALLEAQIAVCRDQLERLEREAQPRGEFARMMRELRLVATRGTIAFLAEHAAAYARSGVGASTEAIACEG